MQKLLIVLALAGLAIAAPIDMAKIREYIPPELLSFYDSLTPEDHATFKQVGEELKAAGQLVTEDIFLNKINEKSPSLYGKLIALNNTIFEKINSLPDEPRNFLFTSISKVRALQGNPDIQAMKTTFAEILASFRALSDQAKQQLGDAFPTIRNLVQSDFFKAIKGQIAGAFPPGTQGDDAIAPMINVMANPMQNEVQ